jgi:hypothetical protein
MADKTKNLEAHLNELLVSNAPRLPAGIKKTLVKWTPVIGVVAGVFALLSAWSLWRWAVTANSVVSSQTPYAPLTPVVYPSHGSQRGYGLA